MQLSQLVRLVHPAISPQGMGAGKTGGHGVKYNFTLSLIMDDKEA
jgi:hypothetical protein